MQSTFYSTSAQAAFALLGLWWVVVAERRAEWLRRGDRRRQAYTVSMYFMLTGIMSLASLASANQPTVWRLTFGLAGALGVLETAAALLRLGRPAQWGRVGALLGASLPVYAVVVAVASHPPLARDLGLNLTPLATEAIVVSILIFFGVNFAWLMFFEQTGGDSDGAA